MTTAPPSSFAEPRMPISSLIHGVYRAVCFFCATAVSGAVLVVKRAAREALEKK
jgi:hypothetical protein